MSLDITNMRRSGSDQRGFFSPFQKMDFKVGGTYKVAFINFTNNKSHTFGGEYNEIKPGKLIRYMDRFDDPKLPRERKITVQFREVTCGTEVKILQEGVPDVIPVEMCYLGWQERLIQLAQLVEPEIKQ